MDFEDWPDICLPVEAMQNMVDVLKETVIVTMNTIIVQVPEGADHVWVWIDVLGQFCLGAGLVQS